MSDFAPSIDAARQALPNVPIVTHQHPTGAAGAKASMLECAMRIRTGRLDPRVRAWAIRSLKDAGNPQSTVGMAQALLDSLRKDAIYVNDPTSAEFIQAAHETLCLDDKGLCFRGGDCIPEDTLLLKHDLTLVPIKNIVPGDIIWGRDDWTKVEATAAKGRLFVDDIELTTGLVLRLTANHKVFIKVRNSIECVRIRVSDLHAGDIMLQPAKSPEVITRPKDEEIEVEKINRMHSQTYCYDIQTADHYDYLPEYDVTVSNCDDLLVAYGSATSSVGIPTFVVGQSFDASQIITHVLAGIQDRDGNKIRVDPSDKNMRVGESAMATHEEWIDPLQPLSPNDATAGGGEFVGVGQVPSSTYQLVTNNQITKGGHYRIGLIVSFLAGGLTLSTDPTDNRISVLNAIGNPTDGPDPANTWDITSLGPNGDVTGGVQTWILEGTAQKDITPLTNTPAITYQVIALQVSSPPALPAQPSVDVGPVIVGVLAVGLIGGLIWGMGQRQVTTAAENPELVLHKQRTSYRGVTIHSGIYDRHYVAWTAQGQYIKSGVFVSSMTRDRAVGKAKAEIDRILRRYNVHTHGPIVLR